MFELQFEPLATSPQIPGKVAKIPWDTTTFGFGVAQYELETTDVDVLMPSKINESIALWAIANSVELVGINLPAEAIGLIARIQDAGFQYVDTFLSLRYERVQKGDYSKLKVDFTQAQPEDLKELLPLVSNLFTIGRYHSDPKFPSDLADLRYKDWLERTFLPESNQKILCTRSEGVISGFSVVQIDGENGYFHLLATGVK